MLTVNDIYIKEYPTIKNMTASKRITESKINEIMRNSINQVINERKSNVNHILNDIVYAIHSEQEYISTDMSSENEIELWLPNDRYAMITYNLKGKLNFGNGIDASIENPIVEIGSIFYSIGDEEGREVRDDGRVKEALEKTISTNFSKQLYW